MRKLLFLFLFCGATLLNAQPVNLYLTEEINGCHRNTIGAFTFDPSTEKSKTLAIPDTFEYSRGSHMPINGYRIHLWRKSNKAVSCLVVFYEVAGRALISVSEQTLAIDRRGDYQVSDQPVRASVWKRLFHKSSCVTRTTRTLHVRP